MTLDLKITGGMVHDGNGGEAVRADIGVRDGIIVELGDVSSAAARTMDADGAIVTPGFLDVHAHYDGQASWDNDLRPSVDHGVTTTIAGSCGVGFAPVRPADHDRLIRLMEGVEDIPGTALAEGLTWDWESFPDYLDALERMERTIDIGAQIGHDPVRVFAMGERATEEVDATDDDLAAMRNMIREALQAGAAGFSIGRTDVHRTSDGDWTPSSEASVRELTTLASAFEGLNHGMLQAVSDFDLEREGDRFDQEFDVLEAFAKAGGGRPFSMSLMQRDFAPDQWTRILGRIEKLNADGQDARVQVAPRGIGVFQGLSCTFHPFIGFPSYKAISQRPLEQRVRAMRDPAFKAKLLSEKSDKLAGDGTSVPPLADLLIEHIDFVAQKFFRLGADCDYEQPLDQSIGAEAKTRGVSVWEALYDALLEDDGKALIYFPIYNYTEGDYENVLKMMRHPKALIGLGDGGAHVGTICDASFPTYLMSYWTRDRERGDRIALPRAVQMLTADLADFLGLGDRGRIAIGKKADINIIDHAILGLEPPRLVQDLPAGGKRLLQHARGYRATLVSGVPVVAGGALTGERPGKLVRFGQI